MENAQLVAPQVRRERDMGPSPSIVPTSIIAFFLLQADQTWEWRVPHDLAIEARSHTLGTTPVNRLGPPSVRSATSSVPRQPCPFAQPRVAALRILFFAGFFLLSVSEGQLDLVSLELLVVLLLGLAD